MPARALVVGLGRSGRAAALLLARRGWEVVALDAAAVEAPELAAAGVDVRPPGLDPVPGLDLLVKSPGVPGEAPPVAAARRAGTPVWSEIELAARELPNPLLGITGTNGKTTTTELLAHLLRAAGRQAVACGNQGTPLAGLVGAVSPEAWLCVECSSFQLEDVERFHPRGAVLLNLSPDHLDRHGGLPAYRDAKLRIFARQGPADLAILPVGLEPGGRGVAARRLYEGEPGPAAAAWSAGGLHVAGLGRVIGWDDVPLRGRHNRENAMAAAALAAHAGAVGPALAEGLAGFRPVPHRLEVVVVREGVAYVNDSKATNPDAAVAALDAYPAGVHLIAGGRAKGTSFAALAEVARTAVVAAYLVGEAAPALAEALDAAGVPHVAAPGVAEAVATAAGRARAGETVLLAPACASFDQFRSYEERGEAFRAAVGVLGSRSGRG